MEWKKSKLSFSRVLNGTALTAGAIPCRDTTQIYCRTQTTRHCKILFQVFPSNQFLTLFPFIRWGCDSTIFILTTYVQSYLYDQTFQKVSNQFLTCEIVSLYSMGLCEKKWDQLEIPKIRIIKKSNKGQQLDCLNETYPCSIYMK